MCNNLVGKQHDFAYFVFDGIVYNLEVIVGVKHVQVFYHLLISDIALAE